jgi:hypothetical protein
MLIGPSVSFRDASPREITSRPACSRIRREGDPKFVVSSHPAPARGTAGHESEALARVTTDVQR